jgi:hypothetical protein
MGNSNSSDVSSKSEREIYIQQKKVSDQDNNRYMKIKADFQSIEIPRQPVGNWFTNLINRLIHQEHTKNVKIPITKIDSNTKQADIANILIKLQQVSSNYKKLFTNDNGNITNKSQLTDIKIKYTSIQLNSDSNIVNTAPSVLYMFIHLEKQLKTLIKDIKKIIDFYGGNYKTVKGKTYAYTIGYLECIYNRCGYKYISKSYDVFLNNTVLPLLSDIQYCKTCMINVNETFTEYIDLLNTFNLDDIDNQKELCDGYYGTICDLLQFNHTR